MLFFFLIFNLLIYICSGKTFNINWLTSQQGTLAPSVGDIINVQWVENGVTHNVHWQDDILPTSQASDVLGFQVQYTITTEMAGQTWRMGCDYHPLMFVFMIVDTLNPTTSPSTAPSFSPTSSPSKTPTISPTTGSGILTTPTSSPTAATPGESKLSAGGVVLICIAILIFLMFFF